jgi:hypothetical protein
VSLLERDLLSQLKAQILLPPGSYLLPLLQEQIDPTVWTYECGASQAGPPYSNETQRSLSFHTQKHPLKPEGMPIIFSFMMPIINSFKNKGY